MRILIVGAGIGGMTLAALLAQRGLRPRVIERAASTTHAGYMLGLYPLGHRVLHGLGLHERFVAESVECARFLSCDGHGETISEWSLDPIRARFGPVLSCTRPQLVELLRGALPPDAVEFGRTVTAIDPTDTDTARVTFGDARVEEFDLVVGADGMNSTVRALAFGEPARFDTGWGGWVFWASEDVCPPSTFVELWGAGRAVGLYPTTRGVGVFAGAPVTAEFASPEGRRERLLARFAGMGERVDRALASLPPDDAEMFFWRLADARAEAWVSRRVVLLGDAAAGFLPTAGIGASMAMESAAALADELGRTDVRFLEHALSLYVKRRRKRVESIQEDSRRLAKLMFVSSSTVAAIRNYASRFLTLEMMMGTITRAFDEPI